MSKNQTKATETVTTDVVTTDVVTTETLAGTTDVTAETLAGIRQYMSATVVKTTEGIDLGGVVFDAPTQEAAKSFVDAARMVAATEGCAIRAFGYSFFARLYSLARLAQGTDKPSASTTATWLRKRAGVVRVPHNVASAMGNMVGRGWGRALRAGLLPEGSTWAGVDAPKPKKVEKVDGTTDTTNTDTTTTTTNTTNTTAQDPQAERAAKAQAVIDSFLSLSQEDVMAVYATLGTDNFYDQARLIHEKAVWVSAVPSAVAETVLAESTLLPA